MTVQTVEIHQPEIIRKGIWHYGKNQDITLSPATAGAIRGNFTKACKRVALFTDEGAGDSPRHIRMLVWSYLAGIESKPLAVAASSKVFADGFLLGFGRWQTERLPSGIFRQRSAFPNELQWVLYRARHDLARQAEFPELNLGELLNAWKDESPFGDGADGTPITSMMDFAREMVANPPAFSQWEATADTAKVEETTGKQLTYTLTTEIVNI